MNSRHCPGLAIISGKHVLVLRVPDTPGRDVGEKILSAKGRNRFPGINETAADRVAAAGDMTVLDYRVCRDDGFVRDVRDLYRDPIIRRQRCCCIVRLEKFYSFTERIAVVGAFLNDLHRLPGFQSDVVRDQAIVRGIGRSIAQFNR